MIARRYLIAGRVQGVGFRYFTYRHAVELGVSGWVRNLPSGEVELHAQGCEAAVLELEQRVAAGPSFGFVVEVGSQVTDVEAFDSFEIRR